MDYLAEVPWWLLFGLVGLGVILIVIGRARAEARLVRGGLGVILAGILLAVLSYFLESDREAVDRRTHELVAAIGAKQWDKMEPLLSPNVQTLGLRGAKQLVAVTRLSADRFELQSAKVTGLEVDKPNPDITARMQVVALFGKAPGTPTSWKMEWEKVNKQWVLVRAEFLGGPFISGSAALEKQLPAVPEAVK